MTRLTITADAADESCIQAVMLGSGIIPYMSEDDAPVWAMSQNGAKGDFNVRTPHRLAYRMGNVIA